MNTKSIILSLLLCLLCRGASAEELQWSVRMNDSCSVSLRMVVKQVGQHGAEAVTLERVTMVQRRHFKRVSLPWTGWECSVEHTGPLVFSFRCDITYGGVRYRVRGRYDETAHEGRRTVIQCVPLRLGSETLEQGTYQDVAR